MKNKYVFNTLFAFLAVVFVFCSRPATASIVSSSMMTVQQNVLPYVKIQAVGGASWTVPKNSSLFLPYTSIAQSCSTVDPNRQCGVNFYDPSGDYLGGITFDFMAPVNHYIWIVSGSSNPSYFVISDMKNAVAVRQSSNH